MKIIVRYCLPWGNFSTQAIMVEEEDDVSILQTKIQEKFGVQKDQQILKFKKEGHTVKLEAGKTLAEFGVKEKTIIFAEKIEKIDDDEEIKQTSYVNKGGYFTKLGIMNKISEGDEEERPFSEGSRKWSGHSGGSHPSDGVADVHVSSDEEGGDHTKSLGEKGQRYLLLRKNRKGLLKEVKDGNLEKIRETFKLFEKEEDKEEQIKMIINELGETGWNLMHWAAYGGHLQIVKEFIDLEADTNAETNDGWTVLQLAAYKNHIEVAKALLTNKDTEVNQVTAKGTALHIASKNGKAEMVHLLLAAKADVTIKDEQEVLPLEVASNDKVKTLLQVATERKAEEKFRPPKPPIVKGFMFKRGTYFMKMNQRWMVLNPEEGTLIRYKKKEDFPNKPKEIIPLKSIEGVRRMKAGPLYDKEFYYIQLLYRKRYIFACQNEDTANKWVTYIIQGSVYTNYMENRLQNQKKGSEAKEKKEDYNYFDEGSEEIILDDPAPTSAQNKNTKQPEPDNGKINFQSFDVLTVLGSGAFGKVYKVVKKGSNKVFAMKALKKHNLIVKNQLRYAVTEANVLKMAKHPFVLELHYAFQTPQHLYLVLDYCPGGDLSLHLANKGVFNEDETRFYIAELILAVEHIHSHNVIYRDLKPENILLDDKGHIKLADFGLAKEGIGNEDLAKSFCGSPAYLSPEMVKRRGVGKSADIYGIGTVIFEMLTGEAPYYNDEIPKLYQNITRAKLEIPNNLTPDAKDIITKLLDRDPEQRPSLTDLRKHPFFAGIDWEKLEKKELQPPKQDSLQEDEIEMPLPTKVKDNDYTEKNKKINRVKAYTFVREENGKNHDNNHNNIEENPEQQH